MARDSLRAEAPQPVRTDEVSFFDALPDNRQREIDDVVSPFHVEGHRIPQGVTLEWKRYTTLGQRDTGYENKMSEQGWRPVPTRLFPDFMPSGAPADDPIIRDGMMLMARRAELTEQARLQERRAARAQVDINEARMREAPPDTMTRADARIAPNVKRTVERMPVPTGDAA